MRKTLKQAKGGFETGFETGALKKVSSEVSDVGENLISLEVLSSLGRTLSLSVTAPLTLFGGLVVKEFGDAERAAARLRAALSGSGSGVGKHSKKLSTSLKSFRKLLLLMMVA